MNDSTEHSSSNSSQELQQTGEEIIYRTDFSADSSANDFSSLHTIVTQQHTLSEAENSSATGNYDFPPPAHTAWYKRLFSRFSHKDSSASSAAGKTRKKWMHNYVYALAAVIVAAMVVIAGGVYWYIQANAHSSAPVPADNAHPRFMIFNPCNISAQMHMAGFDDFQNTTPVQYQGREQEIEGLPGYFAMGCNYSSGNDILRVTKIGVRSGDIDIKQLSESTLNAFQQKKSFAQHDSFYKNGDISLEEVSLHNSKGYSWSLSNAHKKVVCGLVITPGVWIDYGQTNQGKTSASDMDKSCRRLAVLAQLVI